METPDPMSQSNLREVRVQGGLLLRLVVNRSPARRIVEEDLS
jgi:hypothetical protein